jgi:hypothetical protein
VDLIFLLVNKNYDWNMKNFLRDTWAIRTIKTQTLKSLKQEDAHFKAAFVARQRQTFNALQRLTDRSKVENQIENLSHGEVEKINHKIYDQLHTVEPNELEKISTLDIMEQLFGIFKSFQKHARNSPLVVDKNTFLQQESRGIVDPDKFPIENTTKLQFADRASIFDVDLNLRKKISNELNFTVQVGPSTLDHYDANNGVFVYVNPDAENLGISGFEGQRIKPGTLMCLFPGVSGLLKNFTPSTEYILRFNGVAYDYKEKIYHPNPYGEDMNTLHTKKDSYKQIGIDVEVYKIPGHYVNFFGVADKINHASEGKVANCQIVDIKLDLDFFPQNYLRYLPMSQHSSDRHMIDLLGVVATQEIESGEELYLDYIESMWYDPTLEGQDWLQSGDGLLGDDLKSEQRKWLTRREYTNQWVGEVIGYGDQKQEKYYSRERLLDNAQRVDRVLNETVLGLQIDGKDNPDVGLMDKARIYLGVREYKGAVESDAVKLGPGETTEKLDGGK